MKNLRVMKMETKTSLEKSTDKAVKHYSSLFLLPSFRKTLLILLLLCICGGLSTISFSQSLHGIIDGFYLGFALFFINYIFDNLINKLVLKRDPLYTFKRTIALSFFCWFLWLFFILLGVTTAILFDLSWWINFFLIGFSTVLIFRFIVFFTTSTMDYKHVIAASLLQPFPCIVPFIFFLIKTSYIMVFRLLSFLIISPIICLISSFIFISIINSISQKIISIPTIDLFKAFLLNWAADSNIQLEEFLEKLGEVQDVEVSLIKFESSKPIAALIVPSVHPGPFKNVGSSFLPYMLKHVFEEEYSCDTGTLLGLLGHELDLASQQQNQKIINHVIESANFSASEVKATPFIKVSSGFATASCQIFGNFAFLSFTLAPKTTEDLPHELDLIVRKEAKKHGLNNIVAVNAHNSINETKSMVEELDVLKDVASNCLARAITSTPLPFEVGATTVIPTEFSLKDGMGPGGITVIVVKVGEKKTVYVVIDGNNIISGLREKILSALNSSGFDGGEIFTTDTHAVSAIILGNRGYHPIGETINHEKLISYIQKAAFIAEKNLESSRAGSIRITIPKVKVIGKTCLESLSLLTDKAFRKAKKMAIPIFLLNLISLILVLMIL